MPEQKLTIANVEQGTLIESCNHKLNSISEDIKKQISLKQDIKRKKWKLKIDIEVYVNEGAWIAESNVNVGFPKIKGTGSYVNLSSDGLMIDNGIDVEYPEREDTGE